MRSCRRLVIVSGLFALWLLRWTETGAWLCSADPPPAKRPGAVSGCDHVAFLRPSLVEGLGGPALEALKSWEGELSGAVAPDGTYYQIDQNNSIVFRIKDGQARIVAGDGIRGHRDGPADRARFDFGVGSYSDCNVCLDVAGNLYVSEALVGRLRKIERRPDGLYWVSTISGGGARMPAKKGESIPAREMKFGGASRFALTPDGTVYFAGSGGIYRVKDGQGTLLVGNDELRQALDTKAGLADWHVGGSHITPEGIFYWFPGGGPNLYRFDTKTGKAERFAGMDRTEQGLDGPTLTESGFHTVLAVYSPDASVIYTCGGDENVPRRIMSGKVLSLYKDGKFRPHVKGGKDQRWDAMAAVQALDSDGRLYCFTGNYGWGGWVVRFTFAAEE